MEVNVPGAIECPGAASLGIKRAFIEATVTRANGTVEHLGIIADSTFDAAEKEPTDAV